MKKFRPFAALILSLVMIIQLLPAGVFATGQEDSPLAGKTLSEINLAAIRGTALAHVDGGVPNMRIDLSNMEEEDFGRLIYFFEFACGLSGYLLEVNPFDQPGVEAYKKNMFALLGKPGYEKETEEIKKRL